MKRILTTAGAALFAVITLSACSADDATKTARTNEPTPRQTITSTPVPGYVQPTGLCEDGSATIVADIEEIALPEGCDEVRIVSDASTITLGPVKHLQVEGNDNAVTVASAEDIAVFGDRNSIEHGGEPKIDDKGDDTQLKAR